MAVTDCAAFIVIVQEPLLEHEAPLQPTKVDPAAGEAVKVTVIPAGNALLQFAPQEIPTGLELIVPNPVPPLPTESTKEVGPLPPPRYTVTKSESVFPPGQASVQTPLYL